MDDGDNRTPGGAAVPNVLAERYASAEMAGLFSPRTKAVLERRLWVAVMSAQAELGVDIRGPRSTTTWPWWRTSTWTRWRAASGSPATT
ncbi:MAG: hypothetical protein R2716_13975 [Microthrixaceae bacterium]